MGEFKLKLEFQFRLPQFLVMCAYHNCTTRMLKQMNTALRYTLDILEIVKQSFSIPTAHESGKRPTTQELYDNYFTDEDSLETKPPSICIFDDV